MKHCVIGTLSRGGGDTRIIPKKGVGVGMEEQRGAGWEVGPERMSPGGTMAPQLGFLN